MLAVERAIDEALGAEFDLDACGDLTDCLLALSGLVLEEDELLPVGIEDESSTLAKILVMYDVAYCCWRNDGAAVELPDDVLLNHIARMKLNPRHCKRVLDFTRMFLHKHNRLLSVESASLRVP